MRTRLCFVFVFSLALRAASPPPVILVYGWYPKCASAPRNSTSTFGELESKLNSLGIATQYLRPCSVPATPGFSRASYEDLGQALGALIDQTLQANKATQVDVIGFSTGSPVIRAYLSGKQNALGGFQPPANHKIRKAVFLGGLFFGCGNGRAPIPDIQEDDIASASRFLWDLDTWNQGGDDLRGIDAIAVAGQGQPTLAGSVYPDGDGVHSLSSASLSFAYPAERTRIIKACHVLESCSPTVSYVDSDSHPVWLIVRSFLTGTDEWKGIGSSPDQAAATYGGVVVAVKDASDNLIDASQVSLPGRVLDRGDVITPGLFYADQVPKGDYTLEAKAQALVPAASFSLTPGTYTSVTMKPGPLISAVVPSDSGQRQPALAAGGAIEIRGTRLSSSSPFQVKDIKML
jgi:pimeloyl-ACP methyl ester carboxylesterase